MAETKQALVAGHICLDVIPSLAHYPRGQFESLFHPGQLITVGPIRFSTGGPVANTGLALHKLGTPTGLIAKVGDDSYGALVRDLVGGSGSILADGIAAVKGETTSYSIIISPAGMDRMVLHCPGANDTFCAADVDYARVAKSHLFHFGYPPLMRRMYADGGRELVQIFQQVKSLGVTTSLDLALPDPLSPGGQADWRHILQHALPFVDIFLPSIEEILYMQRRELYEQLTQGDLIEAITPAILTSLSDELLAWGAKIIVIKLGNRGLYLRTARIASLQSLGQAAPSDLASWSAREIWAACFEVEVVGTTGAGDSTIAGFLCALLQELPPQQAITMALAIGACNVEAADALSGLRSWPDTLSRIRQGWSRRPLDLAGAGWHQEPQWDVWESGT